METISGMASEPAKGTDGAPSGGPAIAASSERVAEAAAAGDAMGRKSVLPAPPELVESLRKPQTGSRFLPRLILFSDMPDRGLFILFVTLGFGLIFGVKTLLWRAGVTYDYSILIAAGAAILMGLYGILAYRMTAVRMRPDRLGDNFYYMGFVFTLASMSAALVQLQSGSDVDSLIGSFGIALFSTILGIAGRVAFIQMRTEVEDIEERVRQDLLEAAQRLRGQLGVAARDLESFRTGIQQAVHERLSESAETFSKMTEAQVNRVKETVDGTIGSVQAAFAAHERAAGSLSRLGDKVTASVDHLVTRIDAINVPPTLLEAKFDAPLAKLGETAAAFERLAEADAERHRALAEASAGLERIVAQVAAQLATLQTTAEKLDAATHPATEMASSLSRVKDTLEAAASAARSLIESTNAARQATHALTGSIEGYGEMVADATRKQQVSAEAAVAEAEAARRRMAQNLEESRLAVAEVQKALADTARVVTQAIGSPGVR